MTTAARLSISRVISDPDGHQLDFVWMDMSPRLNSPELIHN
jgi:predicted lactoylglutathione lyase